MGWLRDAIGRLGGGATPDRPPPAAAAVPWLRRGNDALAAGNFVEAARCYGQGIAEQPGDPALHLNLGFALLEQQQFGAAQESLQRALALRRPGDAFVHEAQYLLARAQAGCGEPEAALASLQAALDARPDFVEAISEGARLLMQLGQREQAVAWLHRLVQLQPTTFHRMLLANALNDAGRHQQALDLLDAVCGEEASNADAFVLRYAAHMGLGRLEEALADADHVLTLVPADALLHANRAVPLHHLGRHDEALQAVDAALRLDPAHRQALVNRATVLLDQVRVPEAVAAAQEALRLHPEDADLHWTLAMALLVQGDHARGWPESEWRLQRAALRGKVVQVTQPRWQGEDLRGRTIFLHAEQGFGDNIQFLRFVPEVAARAQTVLLLVTADLEPLVAGALPANCRLLPQHSALPAIDCHCPLMSLPAVLGTTLATLPAAMPYLRAERDAVQHWRERLGGDGLKVGIAWSGNPQHVNDRNRSMRLATFQAVDVPGCRFFTVQPQMRDGDREPFTQWTRAEDAGRELRDFADTAALLEALDLVVTVDTSVAHLAGALARPVWILLPHAPDWRWMLEREDSPWYPTARLFRQPRHGDWGTVLARVQAELAALAAQRR